MLYSLYFLCALFFTAPVSAPAESVESVLNGSWQGVIVPLEEAYRESYNLSFIIKEEDGIISGFSYISVDDIYSKMIIEGTLTNDLLFNGRDVSVDDHEINQGMEWCMKNYNLLLKKENDVWKLEGFWSGTTSFSTCTPGRVYLKKVINRA